METTTEATKQAARTAIQKIAGTFGVDIVDILLATIVSVDASARTCTVTPVSGPADTTIEEVSLTPDQNDGQLNIPTIGSTVAVAISNIVGAFVFAWSDLDKIIFKGGDYAGLVRVIDLTTKLNNLENLVNDLVSKFNAHTHILTLTSGTGTAAPTAAPETETLTPTQQADIENILILHGSK